MRLAAGRPRGVLLFQGLQHGYSLHHRIRQYRPRPGTGRAGNPVAPGRRETLAIGPASAQSGSFNPATNFIRAHTDATCSIAVGANPIAAAGSARMAANQTEYFQVRPGDKIAVIQNS